MSKLLILHNRPDWYGNTIWKTGIEQGWKTFRAVASDDLKKVCEEYDLVRYYGNTLHTQYLKNIPFNFHLIPPDFIYRVYRGFPEYLGRWVKSMQLGCLVQPLEEDCFIKCAYQKWFEAKVYKKGERLLMDHAREEDWIYVQDIIDPVDEVRCFVKNGKVSTASYYKKNKELESEYLEDIPDEIIKIVKDICDYMNIPYGIVLDFAKLSDGKWVFLEVNEAWASGLYDCDPVACLDVIANSQY